MLFHLWGRMEHVGEWKTCWSVFSLTLTCTLCDITKSWFELQSLIEINRWCDFMFCVYLQYWWCSCICKCMYRPTLYWSHITRSWSGFCCCCCCRVSVSCCGDSTNRYIVFFIYLKNSGYYGKLSDAAHFSKATCNANPSIAVSCAVLCDKSDKTKVL